jgi:hypothetical protein
VKKKERLAKIEREKIERESNITIERKGERIEDILIEENERY